jgi:hypothetical protein
VSEQVRAVPKEMHDAKMGALFQHYTMGQVALADDGRTTLGCSCGMELTNGPTWTLDEHIRLHRAEARFLSLTRAAPRGVPRLVSAFTARDACELAT